MGNEIKDMLKSVIDEALQPVKSQLDENTQLLKAIQHRQEETDAKLENISMDVHKLHGELTRVEEKVDSQYKDVMNELQNLKLDLDFTYQKTTLNERELYKLKSKQ